MKEINFLMTVCSSPQIYLLLRIDNVNRCDTTPLLHHQLTRELCMSWSHTLGHPSLALSFFFFKSLLNLLQYYFCFMFCVFGCEAYGILAPWPVIEPVSLALEGSALTTGPPGKPLTLPLENALLGLPWWYSGSESACQCRGHRLDP